MEQTRMTTYDMSGDAGKYVEHLDFYIRRAEGELVLVETLLKRLPGQSAEAGEVVTCYFTLDEMPEDWAEALRRQGADLEEGKSCDFVTPEEEDYLRHVTKRDMN